MNGDDSTYVRLRHVAAINPPVPAGVRKELDAVVPFLPMEAIHEYGGYDASRRRPVRELLSGYSYFEDGDILFAKVTPCFENGKATFITGLEGGRGFGTTEVTVVRPGKTVNARFLFYVLIEDGFNQLGQSVMTGAGGLKRVSDSFTKNFKFWLPNRGQQKAISDFIDQETMEIDAFIDDQRDLISLLNERRAATIARTVTQGLDACKVTKNTGIAWIGHAPEHWRVLKLARLGIQQESGVSVNGYSEPASPGEAGVLKTGAASKGYFDPAENKRVVEEDIKRASCPLRHGWLLINRANTPDLVGSGVYIADPPSNLFLSDKLWQTNFRLANNQFIAWWMKSPAYKSQLGFHRVGASASMQNLSFQDFKSIDIALPPAQEQQQIVDYLDREIDEIDRAVMEAREAISLSLERRAALISAAVTGMIGVGDWSRSKERVLESDGVA